MNKTQYRIMIVEDEAVTALAMSRLVQELGVVVCHIADTGREAIDYAAHSPIDAILMDIKLKDDIDGITAAREIGSGVPVIYHSAYIDEQTLIRARETNPVAILEKPASAMQIQESIEHAMKKNLL